MVTELLVALAPVVARLVAWDEGRFIRMVRAPVALAAERYAWFFVELLTSAVPDCRPCWPRSRSPMPDAGVAEPAPPSAPGKP